MWKPFVVPLALPLLLSLGTACSKKKAPAEDDQPPAKPAATAMPERVEVLIVGDESVVGGDNPGWPDKLEAKAKDHGGVSVATVARRGAGLRDHAARIAEADGKPRVFFVTVSLRDDLVGHRIAAARQEYKVQAPGDPPADLDGEVKSLAQAYGIKDTSALEAKVDETRRAHAKNLGNREVALGLVRPKRWLELLGLNAESEVPAAFQQLEGELFRANKACEQREAKCVFVLVPFAAQVDPSVHPTYDALGYETSEWMTAATPLMARLVSSLRGGKMAFVDLLPPLKQRAADKPFAADTLSLNAVGHEIAAEAVWRSLREQGVLGPPPPAKPAAQTTASGSVDVPEGASAEETRLIEKLNGLRSIQGEMKAVLKELPAKKEEARGLQQDIKEIEAKVPTPMVAKVLAEAKLELDKKGAPEGSLLARARGLDAKLKPLMDKELAQPEDPPRVAELKRQVLKQQEGTAALGAGTAVAFRALSVIEQMKIALPRLQKIAKGDRKK